MLASPVLMTGNVGNVLLWVLTTRSVIGWQTFRENMSLSSVLQELWVQGPDEVIRVRMWFTGWPHSVPVAYAAEPLSQTVNCSVHFYPVPSTSKTEQACRSETSPLPPTLQSEYKCSLFPSLIPFIMYTAPPKSSPLPPNSRLLMKLLVAH